jgi:hypothetical protein
MDADQSLVGRSTKTTRKEGSEGCFLSRQLGIPILSELGAISETSPPELCTPTTTMDQAVIGFGYL